LFAQLLFHKKKWILNPKIIENFSSLLNY